MRTRLLFAAGVLAVATAAIGIPAMAGTTFPTTPGSGAVPFDPPPSCPKPPTPPAPPDPSQPPKPIPCPGGHPPVPGSPASQHVKVVPETH